jgi:wyosine [tRNA(Phe)-imidazoG37] synthetase (radical SAM superfamily)
MDKEKKYRYVFGPVPSRRLGRSLGVDIIPPKNCSFDCIYCQLGRSHSKTVTRAVFAPVTEVLAEVKDKLNEGVAPDHITLAGSGEPTLHQRLDDIILGIKEISDVPVALLTNGSLLYRPKVREACGLADVVLPSLDAPDERVFERINRPNTEITFDRLIEGLTKFRDEYGGPIWLEVFMIQGLNTSDESLGEFVRLFDEIRPDKIQLNTVVRPTAESNVAPVTAADLERIAAKFGERAEVVADFPGTSAVTRVYGEPSATQQSVLEMLQRRPCSVDDIAYGLAVSPTEARQCVRELLAAKAITVKKLHGSTFYCPAETSGR